MNRHQLTDELLDDLLRAASPEPLVDDGFVERTMAAVELVAHGAPKQRRATHDSAIFIARALASEHRRYEAEARLWRWATAGVIAGFEVMVVAVLLSPAGTSGSDPAPLHWFQLFTLLAVGATCFAWRELRS